MEERKREREHAVGWERNESRFWKVKNIMKI